MSLSLRRSCPNRCVHNPFAYTLPRGGPNRTVRFGGCLIPRLHRENGLLLRPSDLFDDQREDGTEITRGRRFIRWRTIRNLGGANNTAAMIAKLRGNVNTAFYLLHVFSYQLCNIENGDINSITPTAVPQGSTLLKKLKVGCMRRRSLGWGWTKLKDRTQNGCFKTFSTTM